MIIKAIQKGDESKKKHRSEEKKHCRARQETVPTRKKGKKGNDSSKEGTEANGRKSVSQKDRKTHETKR